ncbi:hypothetical protein SAMN05421755_100460 [Nitrosomonas sp. Nm33]|nr:hypothetical protein SAMN05421755_100460 [Nitrosomonas sp. Nm33]
MQLCACKIVHSAPKRKHLEGENEMYRKDYYIHNVNTRMNDQLRNLGLTIRLDSNNWMQEYCFCSGWLQTLAVLMC